MESEFPANSRRPGRPQREEKPKQLEKVVVGEVVRRKKPLGRRFSETFFGGDARGVWGYVALDVLVPALKDTIVDAVTQGIERMIFPDSRPRSRRGGSGPHGHGYVNYQSRYNTRDSGRRDDRPQLSRRGRANHNFDEIILTTRAEATEVIDRLFDLVSKYEVATVADLYELVGVSSEYTDDKYGWTDIRGAGVTRVNGGYIIYVPRPEPLE